MARQTTGRKRGRPKGERKTLKEKPIDYGSPEMLAEFDAATVAEVNERNARIRDLRQSWKTAAEDAKEAKRDYESARDALLKFLDERRAGRGKPPADLFAEVAGFARVLPGSEPAQTGIPAQADKTPGWYPDDLWKSYPLNRWEKYGATLADTDRLAVGGPLKSGGEYGPILTVGGLSKFSEPPTAGSTWSRKLTDIKGIGTAAADRLAEAETKFWADWNGGLAEKFAEEKGYKRTGGFTVDKPADEPVKPKRGRPRKNPDASVSTNGKPDPSAGAGDGDRQRGRPGRKSNAYREGFANGREGFPKSENPWSDEADPESVKKREDWLAGWEAGTQPEQNADQTPEQVS